MLPGKKGVIYYLNRSPPTRITEVPQKLFRAGLKRGHSQPTASMSDNNPVTEEVQKFDKKCLKKTETAEKNYLPTKEDLELEKKEKECNEQSK
ncbi:hypothetical protein ACEWY4_027074 [Coilia grayii]|uniref:Uncharacterized protein n=1 Tax=Coilia grayii TaxID=363190 RepID=A0ABD1IRE1_9TELE